jgi:hypothetical protein
VREKATGNIGHLAGSCATDDVASTLCAEPEVGLLRTREGAAAWLLTAALLPAEAPT